MSSSNIDSNSGIGIEKRCYVHWSLSSFSILVVSAETSIEALNSFGETITVNISIWTKSCTFSMPFGFVITFIRNDSNLDMNIYFQVSSHMVCETIRFHAPRYRNQSIAECLVPFDLSVIMISFPDIDFMAKICFSEGTASPTCKP